MGIQPIRSTVRNPPVKVASAALSCSGRIVNHWRTVYNSRRIPASNREGRPHGTTTFSTVRTLYPFTTIPTFTPFSAITTLTSLPTLTMNKSLAANLISASLIPAGLTSPVYPDLILSVGLFATSGAVTNWLAVHMLFERVPGMYGSGVVPNRFEEIKIRIHRLIMEQFFSRENVEGFFDLHTLTNGRPLDPGPIVESIDYDRVYDRLVDTVMDTKMGGLLGMMVGPSALEPMRRPFQVRMREEVSLLLTSEEFEEALTRTLKNSNISEDVTNEVEKVILARLEQLTPQMIKQIVQDMIREHLGWLVVWGGVFGGAIGLVAGLVRQGL